MLSLSLDLSVSILAVSFRVGCRGTYTEDGSLVITCEARSGSTESIVLLRYSVNGGAVQTGLSQQELQ